MCEEFGGTRENGPAARRFDQTDPFRTGILLAPSTKASAPRRTGGVKGGEAAERREGTLDAGEHRGQIIGRRRLR
jgi:hypothetical protein